MLVAASRPQWPTVFRDDAERPSGLMLLQVKVRFSRTALTPELVLRPTRRLVATIPTQGSKYNRRWPNPGRKAMADERFRF